jgi:peptide deformylase
VLRQRSREIGTVDDEVRRLLDDMFETMDAARGIGLAANQIGVARRVAVVDAEDDRFEMIDPVILESEGRVSAEEGCLSIPDIYGDVARPERVVLEATDRQGRRYRKEAAGLKARAIQHEIDHLDGILFLDHLSLVKRQMLLARYRREHKDEPNYIKEVQAEPAGPE